jgi:hypothetical protein
MRDGFVPEELVHEVKRMRKKKKTAETGAAERTNVFGFFDKMARDEEHAATTTGASGGSAPKRKKRGKRDEDDEGEDGDEDEDDDEEEEGSEGELGSDEEPESASDGDYDVG